MKNNKEINYWKFILVGTFSIFIVPIIETFDVFTRPARQSDEFFAEKFTRWLLK